MPKIKLEADLSSFTAELDKLGQHAQKLSDDFAKIGKGMDSGPAKTALKDLYKQIDEIQGKLQEKAENGLFSPAQFQQSATALDGIAKAAGKAEKSLYGSASDKTARISQQADFFNKQAAYITRTDTLQENLARQGRRRSIEEVREAERRANELIKTDQKYQAFRKRNLDLEQLSGGAWKGTFASDIKSRRFLSDLYQASGIDPLVNKPGFGRMAAGRIGGAVASALPGGGILSESFKAAGEATGANGEPAGAGASGLAFGKTFGAAALAYGAYKLVSGMVGKFGDAQEQGKAASYLTHAIQGSADEFVKLQAEITKTGDSFGATNEETTALASQFAKTAGKLDMEGVAQAGGYARAYGLNPAAAMQFFATSRLSGVTKDDASAKRLALYVGEAVGRSGSSAKMEEFMAIAGSFIQHTAQTSFAAPNAEGFLNLLGGMTGKGAPVGLYRNPMNAGRLMMQADQATRQGGTSEAAHNFWLGALMHGVKGVTAFDATKLLGGGLFGTAQGMMGPESEFYKMAQGMNDKPLMAHLQALAKAGGGKSNLEMLVDFAKLKSGGHATNLNEIYQATFGFNANEASTFSNSLGRAGGAKNLMGMFKKSGIDLDALKDNPAMLAKMASLVGGGREALIEQARHLGGLSAVPEGRKKELQDAIASGNKISEDELRKLVLTTTTAYDEYENIGEKTYKEQTKMSNNLEAMVRTLIPYTNKLLGEINDAVEWVASWKPGYNKSIAIDPKGGNVKRLITDAIFSPVSSPHLSDDQKHAAELADYDAEIERLKGEYSSATEETDRTRIINELREQIVARQGFLTRSTTAGDVSKPVSDMALQKVRGYSAIFQKEGKIQEIDPLLAEAVAAVESSGNPLAISNKGAYGLMQLMPGTAKGLGVNQFDTEENIKGGTAYLGAMLDAFKGDPEQLKKAIAAYNAGEGAVRKANGIPNFKETKEFVPKVLDAYRRLKELESPDTLLPPGKDKLSRNDSQINIEHTLHLKDANGRPIREPLVSRIQAPIPVGWG